ncbi:MAG: TatD family hydrolase [Thermoplasmatota archaeon]
MHHKGKGLPILDAHIHLDPSGRPKEAVRSFIERGGTHLLIVHKPYHHFKENDPEDSISSFGTTLEMTEIARDEGVEAWCVVGPYPGEMPGLVKKIGTENALDLMKDSVKRALYLVKKGKALGIGEVGRVHFPVDDRIQEKCDEVLMEALRGSAELGCPVILHTESFHSNPDLMKHLSAMADEAGAQKERIIKHYSGRDLLPSESRCGLSISLQCRRENLNEGLLKKADFLLETDYIDDPNRPNVVMPPDTVPKKIRWAYNKGILRETEHRRLMIDIPRRVLGMDTAPDDL